MINRRLDSNWDYTFGNGKGNYLSGTEAVAQAIKSRLLLFLAEWWEDLSDGIPMWQEILGSNHGNNRRIIDGLIQDRILGTPDVTAVKSIQSKYDPNTRAYEFFAVVDTAFGQVTVSNVPLGG